MVWMYLSHIKKELIYRLHANDKSKKNKKHKLLKIWRKQTQVSNRISIYMLKMQ